MRVGVLVNAALLGVVGQCLANGGDKKKTPVPASQSHVMSPVQIKIEPAGTDDGVARTRKRAASDTLARRPLLDRQQGIDPALLQRSLSADDGDLSAVKMERGSPCPEGGLLGSRYLDDDTLYHRSRCIRPVHRCTENGSLHQMLKIPFNEIRTRLFLQDVQFEKAPLDMPWLQAPETFTGFFLADNEGAFSPTVADVLAQLPSEYHDVYAYFEVGDVQRVSPSAEGQAEPLKPQYKAEIWMYKEQSSMELDDSDQEYGRRRKKIKQILQIEDKELLERYRHIKPLYLSGSQLHPVVEFDLEDLRHSSSFGFCNRYEQTPLTDLEVVGTIDTHHPYAFHGIFKATVDEVLAQTPDYIVDRSQKERLYFTVDARDKVYHHNRYPGCHVAEVVFYRQKDNSAAQRKDI